MPGVARRRGRLWGENRPDQFGLRHHQPPNLGHSASTLAYHMGISPARLLAGLALHAVPELTALFLPLAAWVVASRRDDWHKLLAATFVTTAIAAPVLGIACLVEVYVSPHLIQALAG